MRCLHPKVLETYKYDGKHRIKNIIYHIVPCGKCINCLQSVSNDWTLRLMLEAEVAETAWFVTLTFNEDNVHDVDVKDIQRFMNSLRKKYKRFCDDLGISTHKLSYFAVGEYGRESNRPHYHLVLFDFPCHDFRLMQAFVEKVWQRGFVKVEPLTIETAGYVAKYLTKIDPRFHKNVPFRIMSLKPAIGYTYFENRPDLVYFLERSPNQVITLRNGRKFRVPRSIRRKFYSGEFQYSLYEKTCFSREEVEAVLTPDYLTSLHYEEQRKLNKVKKRFK